MCGRKTLTKDKQHIIKELKIDKWDFQDYEPSYNISPGQDSPILIALNKSKIVKKMNWGLIPSWSINNSRRGNMINARYETIFDKPSYKNLIKTNRCIILADGYYEWSKNQNNKIANYIHSPNNPLLPIAGLWSKWEYHKKHIYTYTIITINARKDIKHIHNRMPLILNKNCIDNWLNNNEIMKSVTLYNGEIAYYPVTSYVNSTKNNSKKCIEKLHGADTLSLFNNN